MARSRRSREGQSSTRVVLRLVVLSAFVATLVVAGPKVWRIAEVEARERGWISGSNGPDAQALTARSAPAPLCFFEPIPGEFGPAVALGRVDIERAPSWIDQSTFLALAEELETRLRGQVGMRDEDRVERFRAFVAESPWLREVTLEPEYPDRFRVSVALRRPEARLIYSSGPAWLVDSEGVLIPAPRPGLFDRIELPVIEMPGTSISEAGAVSQDPRVLAAVSVAREWREDVAPEFPRGPKLVAVDPRNLGWQFIQDLTQSEILVGLRAADGQTVWFQSGRAARDGGRLDGTVRAQVLRKILQRYPGLRGLASGDLRLRNTWAEAISLRG